jgi:hypothetical protein
VGLKKKQVQITIIVICTYEDQENFREKKTVKRIFGRFLVGLHMLLVFEQA